MCLRINPLLLHKALSSSSSCLATSRVLHTRSCATPTPRLLITTLVGGREFSSRGFAPAARSTSPASAPQTEEQEKATNEITVSAEDHSENAPRERGGGRRGLSLWRKPRDIVPFGGGLFTPSGLGNALLQTTESINRLLRSLSPSHLFRRRWKEDDNAYKLQFEVPGLSKDDLKVTVEDNLLVIRGEKKEEEESSSGGAGGWDREEEEYYWSTRSYGYCHTSLMLPEDAKADEIKAEVKHGMLYVTIPRMAEKRRHVREVEVH
ncbi:HSP20 family small heat-shock protein [Streptococcus anginosus]|uniref:HSP20 family small heat-shock protein n=1 Tax=Streptococcus anginosus TaxID=1328 RepID=UPI002FF24C8D